MDTKILVVGHFNDDKNNAHFKKSLKTKKSSISTNDLSKNLIKKAI
jgi:hypothetical protein